MAPENGPGKAETPLGQEQQPTRVAVIGTGLAGLTTAWLLARDDESRFRVTVFEQADKLSFDAASMTVQNDETGLAERIDLPMRGIVGGYHANVTRMYQYLKIPTHVTRLLYVFANAYGNAYNLEEIEGDPGAYFAYSSNFHQGISKPGSLGWVRYILEVIYLALCNFWFLAACFLIEPKMETGEQGLPEDFGAYSRRIWLPQRFVRHYVLPSMSVISTCTLEDVLRCPASDIVNYRRRSNGKELSTVCGGVNQVQSKLTEGLDDIRLNARVEEIVPLNDGRMTLRWASMIEPTSTNEELFDKVVLAVSPDVASSIFSPIRATVGKMPTRRAEALIVDPTGSSFVVEDDNRKQACAHCSNSPNRRNATQTMVLRTNLDDPSAWTEALHIMPNRVVVVTCPLESSGEKQSNRLQAASFTRTLRDVRSKAVVDRIMRPGGKAQEGEWVNGSNGVWLAGSWCWDGMVLLEGCVVSAMRVAKGLGVGIPWERRD